MTDTLPQALLPVGRDCDCGAPLVWRYGDQWCAVYGSHPPVVHYRADLHPAVAAVERATWKAAA